MKCWICGKEATKTRNLMVPHTIFGERVWSDALPNKNQRCYCDECYKAHMQEMHDDNKEYIRLKKKRMFEQAVDRLEHQKIDIYRFKEAIDAVEEFITEHPDKFDSSYEVMAAIVLIQNHIQCKMQHKVGKYQIDFLLPGLRVALEIDGDRHKHRKEHDTQRDKAILSHLGTGWDIIRISTELLDMNAVRLPKAIEEVLLNRGRI